MVEFSPTQKPVALLERIIQASSKPGDVVLELGRHLQESAGIKEKARRTTGVGVVKNGMAQTQIAVENGNPNSK